LQIEEVFQRAFQKLRRLYPIGDLAVEMRAFEIAGQKQATQRPR